MSGYEQKDVGNGTRGRTLFVLSVTPVARQAKRQRNLAGLA